VGLTFLIELASETRCWSESTATVDKVLDTTGTRVGVELDDATGTLDGIELDEASAILWFSGS
jgi:hypothetical protein